MSGSPRLARPGPVRLLARLAALLLAVTATVGIASAGADEGASSGVTVAAVTAPAADDEQTTTTARPGPPAVGSTGDIIPRPGSGAAPQSADDRGGAGQVAILVAICAALAVIAALARRDMRTRSRGR